VHRRDDALLPAFIAAGRTLAESGCIGIATTCGFLARWQGALAAALPVPVLSSALLQVPMLQRLLPAGRRAGIVTYSAGDLTSETLVAAGVDPATPVEGIDPEGYFATTIRDGREELNFARMERDVVGAAKRLVAKHPGIGALVLECANMPPYRAAVAAAVARPVFDAAGLVAWFYAGLSHR
jgi:hypothetical protein